MRTLIVHLPKQFDNERFKQSFTERFALTLTQMTGLFGEKVPETYTLSAEREDLLLIGTSFLAGIHFALSNKNEI